MFCPAWLIGCLPQKHIVSPLAKFRSDDARQVPAGNLAASRQALARSLTTCRSSAHLMSSTRMASSGVARNTSKRHRRDDRRTGARQRGATWSHD